MTDTSSSTGTATAGTATTGSQARATMRNPASSGRSGHSRDGKRARKATTAAAQTMRPAPDRPPQGRATP